MIEMSTAYGIGPDKYGDELQTIRIGNGALNVNWIKQCAEAALDAEREKVKGQTQRAEYAEGKVRELLLKQDALELELSQLQALVRAFFTSEDKWVVAYRELERLGYTLDATTPENGVDSAGRSARKDENRDAVWGKIKK